MSVPLKLAQVKSRLPSAAYLKVTGISFLIAAATLAAAVFCRHYPVRLTLEMSSSAQSNAQLFFDAGHGFSEADSRTVPIAAGPLSGFQNLSFDLPHRDIQKLRFDPLTTQGTLRVRNALILTPGATLLRIPAADILPLNEIASRKQNGDAVEFSTTPGANDPSLMLHLHEPLRVSRQIVLYELRTFFLYAGLLLASAFLAVLLHRRVSTLVQSVTRALRRVHELFVFLARRLSVPGFIEFDSYAIWFYALCLLLFALGGLGNLNGSSIGVYSSVYKHGAPARILLGAPREVRSDEWAYETPDIFNQALRRHPFEAASSGFGGHSIALASCLPVRHISTLFRPQFWPFFVLPVDYAFAVHWQFKGLILLGGLFTFFFFLTGSTLWSATGAAWFFFSPFTQWSYSWASEVPEMIGLICLTIVLACYVSIGKNPRALAFASLGTALCAIDFAMCAYLPFLIPLFWFALWFVTLWCIAQRRRVFTSERAGYRLVAACACAGVIGAVGFLVYRDLRVAIAAIAETSYPGHRSLPGGSMSPWELAGHFLQWSETEAHFPASLGGNISEGSGFLWLAPATLFCLPRMRLSSFQKYALVFLWGSSILFLTWLVVPLPAAAGKLLALDKTMISRLLPPIGLANTGIVILSMAAMRRYGGAARRALSLTANLAAAPAAFLILFLLLRATNHHLAGFFAPRIILWSALISAALTMLILNGRQWALAAALVLPQAFCFGMVNPLERGMDVLTSSELSRFVRAHPRLLDGRWIVFSDSVVNSGFFAAMGCNVYTGVRYVPDIDHFQLFAKARLNVDLFNRLGYLNAHPLKAGTPSQVVLTSPAVVTWQVAPTDPLLRQLGIKYAAFAPDQGPSDFSSGLIPLAAKPVDGFCLYRLP